LLGDGETGTRPFHRLISHVRVAPLAPADLDAEDWMRAALRRSPDEPVSASPSR
jgi:hypothetical protein